MMWIQDLGLSTSSILIGIAVSVLGTAIYGYLSSREVIVIKSRVVLIAVIILLFFSASIVAFFTIVYTSTTTTTIASDLVATDRNDSGATTNTQRPANENRTGPTVRGNTAGQIRTPVDDQGVGSQFPATGSIDLPNGVVGWVAVRIGQLYWPKEPPINRSGNWQITVFEGGSARRFGLVLIAVDSSVNQDIERWFDRGLQTGSWPGMTLASRSILLDSVIVRR